MQSFFQTIEWYELGLQTGNSSDSGTTSNVFIRITCCNGKSPVYWLHNPIKSDQVVFVSNSIIYFLVPVPKHIGNPIGIHIWHDNTGHDPSWFLKTITIRNVLNQYNDVMVFSIQRWLSMFHRNSRTFAHMSIRNTAEDDTPIDNESPRIHESQKLDMLLACVTEYHIWIGFMKGTQLSRFSKQRRALIGIFSFLLMSSTIIFMRESNLLLQIASNADLFCIVDICIKNYHVSTAMQALLISLLPRTICCAIFERAENNLGTNDVKPESDIHKKSNERRHGKYRRHGSMRVRSKMNHSLKTKPANAENLNGLNPFQKHDLKCNFMTRDKKMNITKYKKRIIDGNVKLQTIPENSIIDLKVDDRFIPDMPEKLRECLKITEMFSKHTVRIFSILLLILCAVLTFYVWSTSHSWNKLDDNDSIIMVALAIIIDICIAQFIRPFLEYIRILLMSQQRVQIMLDCPVTSLRNVLIDFKSQWIAVHRRKTRSKYLNKIYNSDISISAVNSLTIKQVKSKLFKKLCLKELPYCLMFSIAFTIYIWQGICSTEFLTYQNMQNNFMKLHDTEAANLVCT